MKKIARIFGVKISNRTMAESIKLIEKRVKEGNGMVVYCSTLNEMRMCEKDSSIKKMFDEADLITADGMPLVWGIRLKTGKGERVYGPDLMREMISKNKKNYIFVGDEKNKKYFEKIGEYVVLPMREKFSEEDYQKLLKEINRLKGKIVWLGLGAEKQVEVAYELKKRGVKKIIITVGAAFDFLSGNKKQAPKWLRNVGGEWLFRLISEPKRLVRRYWENICFLGRHMLSILKDLKYFGLYLFLSLVLISPQFLVRYPGLIDDGTDLLYVKKLSFLQIITDQLFNNERSRPLRYIYRKFLYEIFGLNMLGCFLANAIILAIICFLLYVILNKITSKKKIAFWGSIFFLLSAPTVASFYKLGTDEPLQLLFIFLAIFFWLKGKDISMLFWLVVSLLVKETSILFMFAPLGYFFIKNKWRLFLADLLILIFWGGLVAHKYILSGSIYIHHASFSWNVFSANFEFAKDYFWAIFLMFIVSIWEIAKHRIDREKSLMLGSMILMAILPLTFWQMNSDYYYLIILSLVIIGFGYVISVFPKIITPSLMSLYFFILLFNLLFMVIPVAKYWHTTSIVDGALSEYLLKTNFKDVHIFSGVVDLERNDKIYVYSNEWSQILSNGFDPPRESWINTFGDNSNIERIRLSVKSLNDFIKSKESKRILISDKRLNLPSNFLVEPICGSSFFLKTSCGYFIYKPIENN